MNLAIPELSLVVLIGPSGSGKSTFARKHFRPTEVLSSDFCRGVVCDDENDQTATDAAFEVLHFIAAKRLAAGKLTVIDATNVQEEARKPLVALAREYHCLPVAIVFNLPEKVCQERNGQRPDRDFGPHVLRQQRQQLRRSLPRLEREGFRHLFILSSPEEVEEASVERRPLWTNLKHERGPFDIIGDVHGCYDELVDLLETLGYEPDKASGAPDPGVTLSPPPPVTLSHPQGRKAIFLGDLVDRGPDTPGVLRLVMGLVEAGTALCVPGNHDVKLLRALRGKKVQTTHGLAESLAQLEPEPPEFKAQVAEFLDRLVSHYVLDEGRLVVAHAGMKAEMQGRASGPVRSFALYGETTGETDEWGLPVRHNWAEEYRGPARVVYGHTPVPEAVWLNRTINIDTGCVFGGQLTALRYPEGELVSVPAAHVYYQSPRPFPAAEGQVLPVAGNGTPLRSVPDYKPREYEDLLDLEDVLGKRLIHTRLHHSVTIREEQASAALEVMSRFAANPRWLIYLPPTMSPCETSQEPDRLEHPAEAFAYYRQQGVPRVVCEEKHMGSRAVVVVCRDEDAARKRFGVAGEGIGVCYTRTGRRFFEDRAMEAELLARVRAAVDDAGFWEEFHTDWMCLDCELMPWSAKAQELLRQQYAAVGAASRAALAEAVALLEQAVEREEEQHNSCSDKERYDPSDQTDPMDHIPREQHNSCSDGEQPGVRSLRDRYQDRAGMAAQYVEAYRRYCWPVRSVDDLKLALFHLLATEGAVHVDKDHGWHLETLARLCKHTVGAVPCARPILQATSCQVVDITDPASQDEGVRWWEELTRRGGEGMVVKPFDFVAQGPRGLVQPAVKCRGREYLRIIYGPEYTAPENLARLRSRGLATKRSLALREFALGVEALERFVRREPLYRVHECVFGILALESEPVDPRL